MAVVRQGDSGPVFGLQAETTGFVQDFTIKTLFDEHEVPNNIGETVAFGQFNERFEGTFTLIDKNGGSVPAVATAVVLANCSECAKVQLTEKERTPEQKGSQKHKFSYKAWVNLTLT